MKLTGAICMFAILWASLATSTTFSGDANARVPKATKADGTAPSARAKKRSSSSKSPNATDAQAKATVDAIVALAIAEASAADMTSCEAVASGIDYWLPTNELASYISSKSGEPLVAKSLKKGEFETAVEYKDRVHGVLSSFVGNPDRVFFRIPISAEEQLYDADIGMLTISIQRRGIYGLEYLMQRAEKIVQADVVGQTVGGLKFKYDVLAVSSSTIQFEQDKENFALVDNLTKLSNSWQVKKLKVDSSTAIALEDSLELIVFGSLVAPFFEEQETLQIPSLDRRTKRIYSERRWTLRPRCGFLYDNGKKEILETFPHDTSLPTN
jgi:hypothetical protein